MPPSGTKAAETQGGKLRFFCLLWLAGLAMRETLLVVPPIIPQIHEDLRMSETQIGLLIGNEPARRAYLKHGFRHADEKRDPEFEAAVGCPGLERLLRPL